MISHGGFWYPFEDRDASEGLWYLKPNTLVASTHMSNGFNEKESAISRAARNMGQGMSTSADLVHTRGEHDTASFSVSVLFDTAKAMICQSSNTKTFQSIAPLMVCLNGNVWDSHLHHTSSTQCSWWALQQRMLVYLCRTCCLEDILVM